MAIRAQPFFANFYDSDGSPLQNTQVTFQIVQLGSPPLLFVEDSSDDNVSYNAVVYTTDSSGHIAFNLIAPGDLNYTDAYYLITYETTTLQTTNFTYTSPTPLNLSTVLTTPGSGPSTVAMTAQWWEVDAVGDGTAYLVIGLEVDGIVDATSEPVSATDQVTYAANSGGTIIANLIPTSAYRGGTPPKYRAVLPSGQSVLFTAPDGGGEIFQSISVASGTSLVSGPPGLVWEGVWSSATAYSLTDAVSFNGSSYVCITANTNQQPDTHLSSWSLLAQGASLAVEAAIKVYAAANFT